MSNCSCSNDWRVESLHLATGIRKTWLSPTGLSFDQLLNEVGSGSVSVPVRSVTPDQVWPHSTSVAITRITGPGASPERPVCEFLGMVEDMQATSGGSVQLGLKSIEQYLAYRLIHGDRVYSAKSQTEIGAALVNLQSSLGILLFGTAYGSTKLRDRTYLNVDRKQILEAVLQLTQVIDGPDYQLLHTLSNGIWGTEMRFLDYLGSTTPKALNARVGVGEYGISVRGDEHATRVIGVGENPAMSYTQDNQSSVQGVYPLFERSVAWSDVSIPATLQDHTKGEAANNLHPAAVPDVTVVGTELAARYGLGDTIDLDLDHGAIRYKGLARVIGKSWSSSNDSPTQAALTLTPLDDAGQAILGATTMGSGPGCC